MFLARSDTTARIAAEAAKQSAEALPAIERAYIYLTIEVIDLPWLSPILGGEGRCPNVSMVFENYGRTPAEIVSFCVDLAVSSAAPDLFTSGLPSANIGNQTIVSANDIWGRQGNVYTQLPVSPEDAAAITKGTTFLWLHGQLTYLDIFETERVTRFRLRYDSERKRFSPFGGKPHNERT